MNILLISDEPEKKTFEQISILKKEMERVGRNEVDSFIFSKDGIFLNQERIGNKTSIALKLLERLIVGKKFDLLVISLILNNLKKLFLEKRSILDLIKNISPTTGIFLFGASSVIESLEKEKTNRVFLYSRPGVSKLTIEFKNDLIDYVRTNQLK